MKHGSIFSFFTGFSPHYFLYFGQNGLPLRQMKNSDAQNTAVPNMDAQNLDALFAVFFPVVHLIVRLRAHTFKIIPVERLHTTRKIEKPENFRGCTGNSL